MERSALQLAVERDRPGFLRRLDGEVCVETVRQRWFARHCIAALRSTLPSPPSRIHVAAARSGEVWVLTGCLENVHRLAERDPPRGLRRPAGARGYAHDVMSWTEDAVVLCGFAGLPWRGALDGQTRERVEVLRLLLGERIHPPRVFRSGEAHRIEAWLLCGRKLVFRETLVPWSGFLEHRDHVVERELPVA